MMWGVFLTFLRRRFQKITGGIRTEAIGVKRCLCGGTSCDTDCVPAMGIGLSNAAFLRRQQPNTRMEIVLPRRQGSIRQF